MRQLLLSLGLSVGTLLFTTELRAEKPIYYEGVYAISSSELGELAPAAHEKLQLQCYMSFGLTLKDGTGGNYYLDPKAFQGSGKISYRLSNSFACKFTDADMTDFCTSKAYYEGKENIAQDVFSTYRTYTPNRQIARSFLTLKEFKHWQTTGKTEGTFEFSLTRCEGLTVEAVTPYLDNTPNTATEEANLRSLFYTLPMSDADYDLARKVKAALSK